MSDEEYDYDYGSDAEYNYGSENGSDNGEGDDELIEIENAYYEGDDLKLSKPNEALKMFEKVVDLETNRGDEVKWRFKALQNLVTIYFSLGENDKMIERYRTMLIYMSKVTRNECTDAINIILDTLQSADLSNGLNLSEMYKITLEALKKSNNERLWFTTNLKLAKIYLDLKNITELEDLIILLKTSCQQPDGSDDLSKGTYLLEIYCIEIQLCSLLHNTNRMRLIYPKTLNLNNIVCDPRIMSIIREEGGKMYLHEGLWNDAYNEFYESFRSYQQTGNVRAKVILKYVLLASILSLSDINPFDAREVKVYSDDTEIIAMSQLRNCMELNNIKKFESIIANKSNKILEDELLMKYIDTLRYRMKEHILISLCKPYKSIQLSFLCSKLLLNLKEINNLLINLILEDKLKNAFIDEINGLLIFQDEKKIENDRINKIYSYSESQKLYCDTFPNKNFN